MRRIGKGADRLDGQHGAYYLNYNNLTNTPTIPTNNNQLTNGAGYVTTSGWTSGNDGPGSGLDADTLDGIQASSFLRSDAADTGTGPLQINGTGQYVGGWGYNTIILTDTSGYPGIDFRHSTKDWLQRMSGGTDMQWAYRDNANYTERMKLTTGGVLTVNSNTVWNSGNDGSGSGLDADLLDGVQGASYLRSDTSDTFSGQLDVSNNSGVTGSSAPGYTQVNIELITSSNNVPAISFHRGGYSATTLYEFSGELYVNAWIARAQTGLLLSSGNIGSYAWTSSNDGSGSGLDADSVDGVHASNIPHRNTGYYRHFNWIEWRDTGAGLYWSNSTGSGWHIYPESTGNMRFRSGNSGAGAIRCNTNGSDRNYIYWNNSNQVGFLTTSGGWAFKCDNSGNVTATGNVTAYSDIRLKTDIEPIESALERVSKLQGIEYTRKSTGVREMGFIAQDVIGHEPTLVDVMDCSTTEDESLPDMHVMKYQNAVALLVEAIKEQQTQIDELKTKVS